VVLIRRRFIPKRPRGGRRHRPLAEPMATHTTRLSARRPPVYRDVDLGVLSRLSASNDSTFSSSAARPLTPSTWVSLNAPTANLKSPLNGHITSAGQPTSNPGRRAIHVLLGPVAASPWRLFPGETGAFFPHSRSPLWRLIFVSVHIAKKNGNPWVASWESN